MSALAIILHIYGNLSIRQSYFLIGIISASLVSVVITHCDIYNFTQKRLYQQYIILQIFHFLTFSIIIANIYKFLCY